ncbi:hypothetical protein AX15_007491 [Amanita polypyramis BW_CC]|nr:hypothetical protein AX15_007491 [Amanita polypyramis BW_CC]
MPPSKESAGAKVLKKMGWKPGQGIGPRISYRRRKLQDMQAKTAKPLSLADVVITEEEEEASKHKYPQRDVPVPVYERKENCHGIGYQPGLGLSEGLGRSKAESENGPKISAGFGLGALNDAEEDDLDIYDGGYKTNKSRIAYDISEQENDTVVLTQRHAKAEKKSSRPAAIYATFSSGIPVLSGFVPADKPISEDRWYPGPDVPQGWKPNPRRVWESDPDKENIRAQATKSEPVPYHKWKTGLTAEERGSLLGEAPISAASRSVFEYISQKDRERIQNLAAGLTGPQPMVSTDIHIPRTEPRIAQAALQGFQPFISDAAKHDRYTTYLLSQVDPDSTTPETLKPLPEQRTEEFNKELEDYAKAAAIFKPMTGAMAGRFTSATVIEHGPKAREGLHTPSAEDLERHEAEEKKIQEEKLTPQQNAAKLGMYGPMTREVQSWQPARLLCKRFGVKEPEVRQDADSSADAVATAEPPSRQEQAGISISAPDTTPAKRDLNNVGLGEDESQGVDTLSYQRPSMDIFKAIFASDEEESGDEDVKEEDDEAEDDVKDVAAKFFPESNGVGDEGPVDLNTFKPTFIPRDRKRKDKGKEKDKDMNTKKKGKKDKEKKKDKVLVSFEMEEDGGGLTLSKRSQDKERNKDRPKKKRKEKERQEDGGDEAMWASKAPAGVKATAVLPEKPSSQPQPSVPPGAPALGVEAAVSAIRGRKRAVDFM